MTASTPVGADLEDWARIYPPAFEVVGKLGDVAVGPRGFVVVGDVEVRRDVHVWAAWSSADGLAWERTSLSAPVSGTSWEFGQVVATKDGYLAIDTNTDGAPRGRTSADGLDWVDAPFAGLDEASVRDVTAGGPGLVAVGSYRCDGAAWLSSDGVIWSRVDLPDAKGQVLSDVSGCVEVKAVHSTRYGLIALGDDAIWSSVDGRRWERAETPEASHVDEVAETAAGLLAVGQDTVWTSDDGQRWVRASEPSIEGSDAFVLDEISVVGTDLLATGGVDEFDGIWRSSDGIRWTAVVTEDLLLGRIADIVRIDRRTVAIGSADVENAFGRRIGHPAIWVSPVPPGPIATPRPDPSAGPRPIGEMTWERLAEIPDTAFSGVAVDGSGFVAFGKAADDRSAIWGSSDGRSWTRADTEVPVRVLTAAAVRGFVAIENWLDGTYAWSSPDGRTWRRVGEIDAGPPCEGHGAPVNPDISALATNGARLVAVGGACNKLTMSSAAAWASSDGGATWVRGTIDADRPGGHLNAVTADRTGFTAVGADEAGQPLIWSSRDGLAWTSRLLPSETYAALTDVAVGPAGIVAVGYGSVRTLPDGIAWIRSEQPGYEAGGFEHVLSDGRTYYAWGESPDERSTALWLSVDGRSWGRVELPDVGTDQVVGLLAFDGRLIVAIVDPNRSITTIWSSPSR